MNFRVINIDDKRLFDRIAIDEGYYGCNLDFATLYMWNIQDGTTVFEDASAVYTEAKFFRHIVFLPPVMKEKRSDITGAVEKMYAYSRAKGQKFIIKALSKDMLSRIDREYLARFEVTEDRNNFDYIYNSGDLIDLPGKAFHSKRNHISRFRSDYSYEYRPYVKSDYRQVMDLYEEWASYQSDIKGVAAEKLALTCALSNTDALGLAGAVILIDGCVRAFTFGSKSYNGMGIVHFEKADINYKGIYAAINNFFARSYFGDVAYINRQEDLGIENLRKSKLSYNPAFFAEKYILTEKP